MTDWSIIQPQSTEASRLATIKSNLIGQGLQQGVREGVILSQDHLQSQSTLADGQSLFFGALKTSMTPLRLGYQKSPILWFTFLRKRN